MREEIKGLVKLRGRPGLGYVAGDKDGIRLEIVIVKDGFEIVQERLLHAVLAARMGVRSGFKVHVRQMEPREFAPVAPDQHLVLAEVTGAHAKADAEFRLLLLGQRGRVRQRQDPGGDLAAAL